MALFGSSIPTKKKTERLERDNRSYTNAGLSYFNCCVSQIAYGPIDISRVDYHAS